MSAKNRYQRTRSDHSTELTEDYVEAIAAITADKSTCRVKELAEHFMVSHVTVTRMLSRLEREKLVRRQPYGPVFLTVNGEKLANESKERHDVVRQFLVSLGVNEKTAEIDAEGMEHHVGDETLKAMRRFTGGRRAA
jgi:DtxR family manganese transport transcriptional regulator